MMLMKKTLYLECSSGISGDMTVAALLDLGADKVRLEEVLKSVPVTGFKTQISRVKKTGIDCCDFDVILDREHENYDHDMEYLYGHRHSEAEGDHEHRHGHEHGGHGHEHDHDHEHGHSHVHRGLREIRQILDGTKMSDEERSLAYKIFDILAAAEAKAHGCSKEEVHFHEVGAVDSIVDIISMAVCFTDLKIEEVIIPCLYEGKGSVRCQHGVLPVPVPAVLNIAEANGLKMHIMDVYGEYVTPTGAAFAAAVVTKDALPESFKVEKTGLGAGKREHSLSGILRAMLISGQ